VSAPQGKQGCVSNDLPGATYTDPQGSGTVSTAGCTTPNLAAGEQALAETQSLAVSGDSANGAWSMSAKRERPFMISAGLSSLWADRT
jgi:hypothetical protein